MLVSGQMAVPVEGGRLKFSLHFPFVPSGDVYVGLTLRRWWSTNTKP
ncbi:MAG: hypothetical protein QOK33_1224 [Mycobacterium sp.]|jgi:hypothetical protein|nr:hypothetical protein [Mycobacterium sp.]